MKPLERIAQIHDYYDNRLEGLTYQCDVLSHDISECNDTHEKTQMIIQMRNIKKQMSMIVLFLQMVFELEQDVKHSEVKS